MPLFYQHNINDNERLGVWKIEEHEDFFLRKVPANAGITHEHKRLQHLAGRYLLQQLFPDFPYELIQIADTRKPFLFNDAYHFSISHCDDYAAALVSRWRRVGVDIELVTSTIGKIRNKFLNDFEIAYIEEWQAGYASTAGRELSAVNPAVTTVDDLEEAKKGNLFSVNRQEPGSESAKGEDPSEDLSLLTLCWSAKEAIYKWYGKGLVDFKKHIQLTSFSSQVNEGWMHSDFLFQKEKPAPLELRSRFFGEAVLTYVIS